jgi:hypothetical protein
MTPRVLSFVVANVRAPQTIGGRAASSFGGTWGVIAHGVAKAIIVPLTG